MKIGEDKPCTTIGELGVHVDYIRVDVKNIADSLKTLNEKLADMPTRAEFTALKQRVDEQSAGRTFSRATIIVAQIAAAVAAVAFLANVVVDLAAKFK